MPGHVSTCVTLKRLLSSLAILASMLVCQLPLAATPSAPPAAGPAQLKSLYNQPVAPSSSDQTLTYTGKVSLVLPGGSLSAGQTFNVASATNLPAPNSLRRILSAYDLSLGDQHTFAKDLTIEIAYDPKQLDPNQPAAAQLGGGYWDEANGAWAILPVKVDEARHVVSLSADHLSIYGCFEWMAGYSNAESTHFSAYWDDKALKGGAAQGYQAVAPHKRTGIHPYISDMIEFLEAEYSTYKAAGYSLPTDKIVVELVNKAESETHTLRDSIDITPDDFYDPDLLRHDTAHELFHIIQIEAEGRRNYVFRGWWNDATADYAADMVAWGGTIHKMGADIKPKFLETSLTATANFHAYSASHFIDYLVKHQSIYAFSDLFWQTAAGSNTVIDTLIAKIQDPVSFSQQYQAFASFFVLNPASPDKKTSAISKDIAAQANTFAQNDEPLTAALDVDYFAAKVWAVQNLFERDVLIEREDKSAGSVTYAVLQGDTRSSPVSIPPTDMETGNSVTIHLKAGETLFLVADNHISTSIQTVQLKVSQTSQASGMFNMRLKFTDGCNVALKGDYNSFSRLNSEIPVKIDGKKVSINYDKTTGVKHFVANGSGTIDSKGVMTLNFTMTYTLTMSCDGKDCTGTESGSGAFTGTWSQKGWWEGKASGSVDVDYPNSLGKLGNNAGSCSTTILELKIKPGFDDSEL